MSDIIEITGDDISILNDSDLRSLIGLLCESDYRLAGLSTKGITWGGHQDASDGGLDVVVRDDVAPPARSFMTTKISGFQVKKSNMPPSEILKEMKPEGILRKSIKSLIKQNGTYIIVSSNGSTTDTALKNRLTAMREAISTEEDHQDLHLEFFDRGRVATWVRSHPSLILWVRNKIGKPLKGWRSYDNWANSPEGLDEEYLQDDELRLHDQTKSKDKGLSVEDGILKLRSNLAIPRASLRLTGLSGVGKTRLVQALFDQRVSKDALSPSLAVYTDMSDSPLPDPSTLANQLIADRARAILIIDNCPPDLHQKLTQICSSPNSTVSLLTVEYDVRDDLPEATSVFRLEPTSEKIITILIEKRFPHISPVDVNTIANFAGGNMRVAISLASTIQQGETLSGFRNEELFKRLFWQRNNQNDSLLISAEVCSLVYSFNGEDASSDNSEIDFLASLARKTSADLYRDIAELKARDLIQSRSVWRAVLPHAIANRLATRALNSIPKDTLMDAFLSNSSERLITSFSRRLSFLHDCSRAIEIVNDWLGEEGWIRESIKTNDSFGITILKNIAPVSPEKTLDALEQVANDNGENKSFTLQQESYSTLAKLLRHLAYEPEQFDRSVKLLSDILISDEEKSYDNNPIHDAIKSLFYIYLSGTHASVETRAAFIQQLIDSDNKDKQELALILLDASLEAWHFGSSHDFDFGARSRDYGYHPNTREEIVHWFDTFIDICTCLSLANSSIQEDARKLLAKNLRGLWVKAGMFESLNGAARKLQDQKPWSDGWLAVRSIIRYDSKDFDVDLLERLNSLEKYLKPSDLLDQARTFALSTQHRNFDLEDDYDDGEDSSNGWRRAEVTTQRIGAKVAKCTKTLNILLPDLVSTNGIRLYHFGRGLAEGSNDKEDLFKILRLQLTNTPVEKRNINVILGFLSFCAENDSPFYNQKLDELLIDELFKDWFPLIQVSSTIDQRGIQRLHKSLDLEKSPASAFENLAWGRAHEPINDDELADLLNKILSKEGGIGVTVEIIKMRLHSRNKESEAISKKLITVAQDTMLMFTFDEERKKFGDWDNSLADIVRNCLNNEDGTAAARQLSQNLIKVISDNSSFRSDYKRLLSSLAQTQPLVFLDVFLGSNDIEANHSKQMIYSNFKHDTNPLDQISDDTILSWCNDNPTVRYPLIAASIDPYKKSSETGEYEWKSIVYKIFEDAPELDAIFTCLSKSIEPRAWSGSRADIIQSRSTLFQQLYEHDNSEIIAWAKAQHSQLLEMIRKEREWEKQRDRDFNESFE